MVAATLVVVASVEDMVGPRVAALGSGVVGKVVAEGLAAGLDRRVDAVMGRGECLALAICGM